MTTEHKSVLIIFDDRERTNEQIRSFVGERRYGEIIYRRRSLQQYLQEHLPPWAREQFYHLRDTSDLSFLRKRVESSDDELSLFIISSRAGITDYRRLAQLLERLPYAEENFSDRRYKPLLTFLVNGHEFLNDWGRFTSAPIHLWDESGFSGEKVTSVQPLDLANNKDFLLYMRGATEARHFNSVEIDNYFYTKSSTDKRKMLAEFRFHGLVPESMQSWLVQPFDFSQDDTGARYKMMRYYLADAALQWVHGAFSPESFELFIDRLLFFITQRPCVKAAAETIRAESRRLFLDKVDSRVEQLLQLEAGKKLNQMLAVSNPALDIHQQVLRYKRLYSKYEKQFHVTHLSVGHGDPCLSNILYDQERYLLKLIDPKGALTEPDIWTHPMYDLCKISHSILGDYDFINNGLYDLRLTGNNEFELRLHQYRHDALKLIFMKKLSANNYDWKVVRLAEASLFLSMLPLHIDHPNKVTAFLLMADKILDKVEHG